MHCTVRKYLSPLYEDIVLLKDFKFVKAGSAPTGESSWWPIREWVKEEPFNELEELFGHILDTDFQFPESPRISRHMRRVPEVLLYI